VRGRSLRVRLLVLPPDIGSYKCALWLEIPIF